MDDNKRERQYSWKGRIIFVSNIPFRYKAQDIMVIMRQFGRCFRVDLARNGLGQSKGFAFVEFEKQEDAKIAVEQLDTATLENNHLRCEISEFPPDELITIYKKTAKQRSQLAKTEKEPEPVKKPKEEAPPKSKREEEKPPKKESKKDSSKDKKKKSKSRDYSSYSDYSDYSYSYSDSDYSYSYSDSDYSDYYDSDYSYSYSYSDYSYSERSPEPPKKKKGRRD